MTKLSKFKPTNYWSVFDHFVGLALKGLNVSTSNTLLLIIRSSLTSNSLKSPENCRLSDDCRGLINSLKFA